MNHHELTELKRKDGRVGAGQVKEVIGRRKQTFNLSTGKESTKYRSELRKIIISILIHIRTGIIVSGSVLL